MTRGVVKRIAIGMFLLLVAPAVAVKNISIFDGHVNRFHACEINTREILTNTACPMVRAPRGGIHSIMVCLRLTSVMVVIASRHTPVPYGLISVKNSEEKITTTSLFDICFSSTQRVTIAVTSKISPVTKLPWVFAYTKKIAGIKNRYVFHAFVELRQRNNIAKKSHETTCARMANIISKSPPAKNKKLNWNTSRLWRFLLTPIA